MESLKIIINNLNDDFHTVRSAGFFIIILLLSLRVVYRYTHTYDTIIISDVNRLTDMINRAEKVGKKRRLVCTRAHTHTHHRPPSSRRRRLRRSFDEAARRGVRHSEIVPPRRTCPLLLLFYRAARRLYYSLFGVAFSSVSLLFHLVV